MPYFKLADRQPKTIQFDGEAAKEDLKLYAEADDAEAAMGKFEGLCGHLRRDEFHAVQIEAVPEDEVIL